jgi:hypothetical protein
MPPSICIRAANGRISAVVVHQRPNHNSEMVLVRNDTANMRISTDALGIGGVLGPERVTAPQPADAPHFGLRLVDSSALKLLAARQPEERTTRQPLSLSVNCRNPWRARNKRKSSTRRNHRQRVHLTTRTRSTNPPKNLSPPATPHPGPLEPTSPANPKNRKRSNRARICLDSFKTRPAASCPLVRLSPSVEPLATRMLFCKLWRTQSPG